LEWNGGNEDDMRGWDGERWSKGDMERRGGNGERYRWRNGEWSDMIG